MAWSKTSKGKVVGTPNEQDNYLTMEHALYLQLWDV